MADCTYKARPWDEVGIRHLLQRPMGGIFADPGCGKTGQTLCAATILKKRKHVDHVLVLAPLNPVYEVWPKEIEKWGFGLTCAVLHGKHKDQFLDNPADVNVMNYDGLAWLAENFKRLVKPGKRWWLVADESTKLKHSNTQRFKMLKGMLPHFSRRTILTGTPTPNGLLDLFGQVYVVDLGARLGRYVTQYRREFFYPSGYMGYSWVPQENAEKRIYERLDGMFYRVADDVLGLEKAHDVPLYVTLPAKVRKVYDELEEEFVAELKSGIVTAVNAGVLSSKLRQVANGSLYGENHEAHFIHDLKTEAIADLVEQLQGSPLLVGYEFTADGEAVAKRIGAPMIDGSKRKEASKLFSDFNAGKLHALVCQTGAAAHGLNLQQSCHTIALLGLPWNLETYQQFKKRVHRAGQTKQVIVHHVIARKTIDETVWQVLRQKGQRQTALLNAIKKRYR
jgi:SNF2 family DNA or RNA helicase